MHLLQIDSLDSEFIITYDNMAMQGKEGIHAFGIRVFGIRYVELRHITITHTN